MTEPLDEGPFFHGTRAQLRAGDLLTAGYNSNYRPENDPNVTDKKFPGNPTRSYRSREPLRVVREVTEWTRLAPEALHAWRERLAALRSDPDAEIIN